MYKYINCILITICNLVNTFHYVNVLSNDSNESISIDKITNKPDCVINHLKSMIRYDFIIKY